jgi:hypothetical protein
VTLPPAIQFALDTPRSEKTLALSTLRLRGMEKFQRLDAPHIRMRILLKHFGAERAAQSHHSLAVLDARKPVPARDGLFANGALDKGRVHVAGIKLVHKCNGRL